MPLSSGYIEQRQYYAGLSSLMAHPALPDFGRSVNHISTRGDRLCPPNYYWHTWIFRPSDGPVGSIKNLDTGSYFAINLVNFLAN